MKIGLNGILAEAGMLARNNLDLLGRIAAVFFFLPAFAQQLFFAMPVPPPDLPAAEQWERVVEWTVANLHWNLLFGVFQLFGSAVIFTLLLGSARPSLGDALGRTLRLMPGLILVWLGSGLLVMLGSMLFVVPGLYLLGRTFVVGVTYVDRPERGPGAALTGGILDTRGKGWLLTAICVLVLLATSIALSLVDAIGAALGAAGLAPVLVKPLADGCAGAIAATGALAQAVMQVAAYRLLSATAESAGPRPR